MNTDPIAELLTSVRNGVKARLRKVDVPTSRLKVAITDILKKEGYIKNFKLYRIEQRGIIRIYLKYVGKSKPVITGLKRISRPSRRVYATHRDIPKVLGGIGTTIISTSRGIVTDNTARENRLGGEVLCTIW